ncbi:MAG TPA: hypothetical protein VKQ06_00665 [Gammaproteobacteria bacterium]|nr:hypothetical protein [Gammaproteobacteria bacterium]
MKRGFAATLVLAAAFNGTLDSFAQDDLTVPPRLSEATQPPGPPPEQAAENEEIEEIVVVSDQNPWRLPDLGSNWRARNSDADDDGRISADLLPLWNPETEEIPTENPFAVADDFRRVGFIEVFRVRFGGR